MHCTMKVFVSHAHTDEPLARRVTAILERSGLEVRDPVREIMPGDDWAAVVSRALQESQAMVVLLTPDAMRSRWVLADIQYALGQVRFRGRLIPVVVGDPDRLKSEDVPWVLGRMKTIKLTEHSNEEEGIKEIARTLGRSPDDHRRPYRVDSLTG